MLDQNIVTAQWGLLGVFEHTPRRDRLTWTIRRAEQRMAELAARLAQSA